MARAAHQTDTNLHTGGIRREGKIRFSRLLRWTKRSMARRVSGEVGSDRRELDQAS
jgi:hypothetical protein